MQSGRAYASRVASLSELSDTRLVIALGRLFAQLEASFFHRMQRTTAKVSYTFREGKR